MSFGDIVTYACLLVAIWYVPRYLLRVYAPGLYARIQNSLRDAIAAAQARDYARYEAKQQRRAMSSYDGGSHADRSGFEGGSEWFAEPVPGQQNQENQNQNATIEDIINLTYTSAITDQQALTILALMRRENGDYFLSANKIRDIVGGADAAVKAEVAALRPSKPTPPPARSIARPPGGWPKSAH